MTATEIEYKNSIAQELKKPNHPNLKSRTTCRTEECSSPGFQRELCTRLPPEGRVEWDFLHPLKFQPSLILTRPQEKRPNLDAAMIIKVASIWTHVPLPQSSLQAILHLKLALSITTVNAAGTYSKCIKQRMRGLVHLPRCMLNSCQLQTRILLSCTSE